MSMWQPETEVTAGTRVVQWYVAYRVSTKLTWYRPQPAEILPKLRLFFGTKSCS